MRKSRITFSIFYEPSYGRNSRVAEYMIRNYSRKVFRGGVTAKYGISIFDLPIASSTFTSLHYSATLKIL